MGDPAGVAPQPSGPMGGVPGGETPEEMSGSEIKKVFTHGGKKGDPGAGTTGEEPPIDLDEFSKLALDIMENEDPDELFEKLGFKKKDKASEKDRAKRTEGSEATTLGKSEGEVNESIKVKTSVENTLKTPANNPVLRPPTVTDGIPMGEGGIGNPWLQPSLATALFMAWFEILPVLMEIKVLEAKAEGEEMIRSAKLSEAKAGAIMESHMLRAEQMMVEAISLFVQAGIQVAQLVTQVAMQVVGQVMNAVSSVVNMGMQAIQGVASAGMGAVGGLMGGGGGGGGMPSMQMPSMSGDQLNQVTNMMNQAWSAASTVVKAVSEAVKANIEILIGQQEYLKSIFEHMLQTSYTIQNQHREAKKEASELISTFVQAMLQFIQYETVFRTDIR